MTRRPLPLLLTLVLLIGCGETEEPAPPASTPEEPAPSPAPEATSEAPLEHGEEPAEEASPAPPPIPDPEQRAWANKMGDVGVVLIMGKQYARRVRDAFPAFAAVARITNGGDQILELSRQSDEVVLRLRDGTEIPRADVWERGEWMVALSQFPDEDRSRFVYPRGVLAGAGVEFTLTFDADIDIKDVAEIWVRLDALPHQGVWLRPISGPSG